MLIVPQDLVQDATTVLDASSEAALMPVERLAEFQLSRRWRATTISSTPWVEAQLTSINSPKPFPWDTVALIDYEGAPSRNWFRDAHNFSPVSGGGQWTHTNTSLPMGISSAIAPDLGFAFAHSAFLAVANGATNVAQAFTTKPGVGGEGAQAIPQRCRVLVRQGVDDLDFRIAATSAAGGLARFTYDLSAGTSSTATSGSFTIQSHAITDVGDGWWLIDAEWTTDTQNDLTVTFHLLNNTGGTTIPLGQGLSVGAPVLMLQSSDWATAEWPITFHTGSGPMVQVKYGRGVDPDDVLSGWQHMVPRNHLQGWSRYDFIYRIDEPTVDNVVRLEFWDINNTNAFLEAGRLIIGQAIDLGGSLASFGFDARESGAEQEADGGQLYRPQRAVHRSMRVELEFLTKALAFDALYRMQRLSGRSRQVLAIASEFLDSTCDVGHYQQEHIAYGYIDRLDPLPMQSPRIPTRWRWGFTILVTP